MFARILLLIAVLTGLAGGPASPREQCRANAITRGCMCCEGTGSCCAAETAPRERTPALTTNPVGSDLKLALQPVVTLLAKNFAVEHPKAKAVAAVAVAAPA